jgi:demethylmenaquinone methyltransferase / 2-methoxy-6-polyprenyl-1,4-benzoquinol methylase
VALVEFSQPRGGAFAALYRFYFERILPRIGGLVSGSRASYAYLPCSVGRFAGAEELGVLLREAGFARVRWERWTGGIVCLHLGEKAL